MSHLKKPYLVIPLLVEQPTWGGTYICEKKGWLQRSEVEGKKIGQSYELYDKSLLATSITSSDDMQFSPTLSESFSVSEFVEERPFPLIKFTQAKGNSFQLHIKPEVNDLRWKQKAESWYYFENGKITFGIKQGADIDKYKQTCILINDTMKRLSEKIINKTITKEQAEKEAKQFIQEKNPWQFVNVYETKKGDIVDLSGGGLHHSWEEDTSNYPLGNIVYEVQQDVMDPTCTIRSFDQGKFKADGTIREIHIDDYFKYIDRDENKNTLSIKDGKGECLFDTPFYTLKLLSLTQNKDMESTESFHHLFVKTGKISVRDVRDNEIIVGQGHSCFIPKGVQYKISPTITSEVLLTFLR